MSNNQPPLNRSIFSADPLLSNTGDSPFPDADPHSLFNPNFSPGQPRMMNGMGQISTPGVHDINSLLSNQHNPQSYNAIQPKPPLGAGPMGQSPLTLNTPIFPQQTQLPPLNINPQQMSPFPGASINQMQPQIIQQMQMMQPNNQFPYFMDYYRNRMPTNANANLPGPMQQNMNKPEANPSMMRLLMQRQKNPLSPHIRQRSSNKKFVSDDNEEELIDDIPSSDEATFSNTSEDTDFENFPDDYVPNDITQRRTAGRENRKTVQRDDDDIYIDDEDEEESTADAENSIAQENLLEKIYMTRISEGGDIEYLVRFQNSPPALCSWIPELLLDGILNAKNHLDRFRTEPFAVDDIPEESKFFVPVAHRRETPETKPELLFRFPYENKVLFYWDFGSEQVTKDYFNNRLKIYQTNPPIPKTPPLFDEHIVKSKRNQDQSLHPYQIEGVKYLIRSWSDQHGSILADEAGLRKKVQLLSFLTYLNRNTEWHGPFLIACRQKQFQQWASEIENWTDLNCLAYTSDPDQRNLMREYQFPALDDLGNPIPDTYAFNIFLVSYDILVKDVDFIQKYYWEVFVVEDWPYKRNKNGKNSIFNAITKIRSHHHIVLTSKPIQNSLEDLWNLLQFVSPTNFQDIPDYLDSEIDDLTSIQIMSLYERVKPHLLHRTLQEVKDQDPIFEEIINSVHTDEKVAFVSPTQIQKDLLRLANLHKLWRLKGYQPFSTDDENERSKEVNSLRICSHPFLVPDSERFYTINHKMKRQDLLLNSSSKFQFLSHILGILQSLGHQVLMFSRSVELLKLLNQFCAIKNLSAELLIASSTDSESVTEIDKLSQDDSETFIYLLSSHLGAGSGANFKSPTTIIIFDPDWNPEDDINSLKASRNGKEVKEVNIIRLMTYQTYEHEAFVRSQRKYCIWLTILGEKPFEELNQPRMGVTPIRPPPDAITVMNAPINNSVPLDKALDSISSVVRDFSLDSLDSIKSSLRMTSASSFYNEGPSNDIFLEQFPLSLDATARRAKRNHSRDLLLDSDSSNRIYDLMLKYGYGEWNRIAAELPEHSSDQIRRFCICLSIFAFRAMPPSKITYLPVLAKKVLSEEQDFDFKYLLCSNKHTWTQVFPEDHEYALEVDSCKKLKEKLHENAFYFLSVVEMRLIAKCWCSAFSTKMFDVNQLSPPALDDDESKLTAILDFGYFDPFDLRVQAIIDKMRSDLISKQLSEEYAMTFDWWTGIEFSALVFVLKNYKYDKNNMIEFHSRTAIMSKTTYQVKIFVTKFMKMLKNRSKGSLLIPNEMHMMREAPKTLQTAKGFTSWINILVRDCEDLSYRAELIDLIEKKITEIPDAPEPAEGWGDYHTRKFLSLLLNYGIDSLTDLLKDRRFGFKKFLTQSDLDFLNGKKKKRNIAISQLPDFVFSEDDLYSFVRGELDPFAQEEKEKAIAVAAEDGYSNSDDNGTQPKITFADYNFSTDETDDGTNVSGRKGNGQYTFDEDTFSTTNESNSDEEQDDFRPEEE